jgi:hypothetical protein
MLHESPDRNSATRVFRQDSVLSWTLDRLSRAKRLKHIAMICWEDQVQDVAPLADEAGAFVLTKGPRTNIVSIEAIAAAQRWADGWRGGVLSTCDFDLGFHGPWTEEVANNLDSEAVVLIDPASALVDPGLIDAAVDRAIEQENAELFFAPVAPGLGGALLKRSLVKRLAQTSIHPGRMLHYMPEQPMRDPLGAAGCVDVPMAAARTTWRFKLDSDRQIDRIAAASVSLNGTLIKTPAAELVARLDAHQYTDANPREIVVELNTNRATKPILSPISHLKIERPQLGIETAKKLFDELRSIDDVRVTFGGTGDPLLAQDFDAILKSAQSAPRHGSGQAAPGGIQRAVHIETDLLPDHADRLTLLAESPVDIISVHIPALTRETYKQLMGVDRYDEVIENMRTLVKLRAAFRRGIPLVVPTFVKCPQNLGEMEAWYDQWIRAIGCAVITGPSNCAGQIPDHAVADMSPPKRRACARLSSRMTILSDGTFVQCEQDVLGTNPLGNIAADSVASVWQKKIGALRIDHSAGRWSKYSLCNSCTEWHRP